MGRVSELWRSCWAIPSTAFGYRFIADELPARGSTAGENRVARLCSQQPMRSVFAMNGG